MANVREWTDRDFFDEIMKGVTLVDFWAPWCAPCRMQGPIVEQVAARVRTAARIVKVNIDDAPQVTERLGIRSIPTLVVFREGKATKQFVGLTGELDLVRALEDASDGQ
jgi:thioredoxin 1